MRTVIFGAHGFLGQHLVNCVRRHPLVTEVISVTPQGGADAISLRDALLLPGEMDTIIYAAGSIAPGSPVPFLEAVQRDAGPFMSLLARCASSAHRPHVVLLSTAGAIYGPRAPDETVDEDSLPSPRSVYGLLRLSMEHLGTMAHARGKLRLTVLRLSNVYGPGQRVGGPSSLIRTLLESARTGASFPLLGVGDQLKDFIFVDDVMNAVSRVLTLDAKRPMPMVFNVASGKTVSVLEVLRLVEAATGRPIAITQNPGREGDVGQGIFDTARAQQILGWVPQTGLAEGIEASWADLKALR